MNIQYEYSILLSIKKPLITVRTEMASRRRTERIISVQLKYFLHPSGNKFFNYL